MESEVGPQKARTQHKKYTKKGRKKKRKLGAGPVNYKTEKGKTENRKQKTESRAQSGAEWSKTKEMTLVVWTAYKFHISPGTARYDTNPPATITPPLLLLGGNGVPLSSRSSSSSSSSVLRSNGQHIGSDPGLAARHSFAHPFPFIHTSIWIGALI